MIKKSSFSFGVLKPDCIRRGLVEQSFSLIINQGLEVVLEKKLILSRGDVSFLYRRLVEKDFFLNLVNFMTSGDVIVFVVRSQNDDAVKKLNSVVGHVDPFQAKQNTLRRLGENICCNIAHSSSNESTAIEDALYFFSKQEFYNVGLVL